MPRFKDQAICLRHFEWSETSQIALLMTLEHGMVRGVAKGAKRQSPSSIERFSGGIELLNLGQILATTKQTSELATFTEWDLQNDFHYLRKDYYAQQLAMYAGDVTAAMLGENDAHPNIFAALLSLLQNLKNPDIQPEAILIFQWRLLVDSGFKPHLQEDVNKHTQLDMAKNLSFEPVLGGFTAHSSASGWRVSKDTVNLLMTIEKICTKDNEYKYGGILPQQFKPDTFVRANKLLCSYIQAILDKNLPTMEAILGNG